MSVQSETTEREPAQPGGRLFAAYQAVDRRIFSVEAGIVTAATAAMVLFILLDLTFIFVNGMKIHLFPAEGATVTALPIGRIIAAVGALGLIFALVAAGVRQHPAWGKRPKSAQLLLSLGIFAGICGFLVMLVTVHPRWTCLALVVLGGAYAGVMLWRSPPGKKREREATIWAITVGLLVWFCTTLPDRYSSWTTPYALFLLLWSGFIGASMATSAGRHLRIDAVRKAIPARLASRYNALSLFVTAALTGLLCYLAWRYMLARIGNPNTAGEIPDWLKVLAIPISLTLAALRFFMRGLLAATGYVEPVVEDVVLPAGTKGEG